MSKTFKNVSLFLILGILVAGCSKSGSSGSTVGPGSSAPQLKTPQFKGPSSTSATADTSQGALMATTTAAEFNALSSGFMAFYTGNSTHSGNSWTWTYTENGLKGTWTALSSSTGYNWSFVENGTSGSVTYNNWTALSGTESSDGKTGSWTFYYTNTDTPEAVASWTTDGSGNLTGTILEYNASGTQTGKWIFTDNSDNSGELKIYIENVLTWDVKWSSNGSGTWVEYDPNTGATVNSGSWS